MNKVILSHSGKQHSYHVAKALGDLDCLSVFYTSSYITSKLFQRIVEQTDNKFWSRRFLAGIDTNKIESNWRFEFKEMLFGKLYGQSQKTLNAVYERDEKFDHYVASRMNQLSGNIFWGFQGSSLNSLKAAKANGKLAICELATAHAPSAKRILEEEKKLHPEWADSIDNLTFPEQYFQRLCEEPHHADVVIGASQFTLQTLREDGVSDSKLTLLPLGFEVDHIPFEKDRKRKSGPIKVLFAGRITQRKGIKYLLEAMKHFDPREIELHIVGHIHGEGEALNTYKNFVLHAPMQQYELFERYQEFDLFALPSVFEGFGLVIVEAMAAGLPVIATPHTIGPELIENGTNGYIVPVRNVLEITNSINDFLKKDEDERNQMRIKARESALKFSWDNYKERLKSLLSKI